MVGVKNESFDLFTWIIDNIWFPVAGAIGAAAQWLAGRRKEKATAINVELDAARKAREEWELLYKQGSEVREGLNLEVAELKSTMMKVEKHSRECDEHNRILSAQMNELRAEVRGTLPNGPKKNT